MKTGDWPTHASGDPKRVGEMTSEERAVVIAHARLRLKAWLEAGSKDEIATAGDSHDR